MMNCAGFVSQLPSLLIVYLAVSVGAGDKGQAAGQPLGKEHQVLKALAGSFESTITVYDPASGNSTEHKGTVNRRLIMDGLFLQSEFETVFRGERFRTLNLVGYDTGKKRYVSVTVRSDMTGISTREGDYDVESKTIVLVGEDSCPPHGDKIKSRHLLKIVSSDEQVEESYFTPSPPDGAPEMKLLKVRFSRRK
jgi:hypothetical protein